MLHYGRSRRTTRGPCLIGMSAALLLACIPHARAADGAVTVPLTYHPVESAERMIAATLGGTEIRQGGVTGASYQAPAGLTRPRIVRFGLPCSAEPVVVAMPGWGDVRSGQTIWVDWNGDRKFGEDEAIKGVAEPGGRQFVRYGAIARPKPDGTKAPEFFLVTEGGWRMCLAPAGIYEGQATLGSKAVKVGLADRNLNGRLGDADDAILVDFDGDGVLHGPSSSAAWNQEAFHIGRVVQMPDGRFYRAAASADESNLSLTPDPAATGRIRVGYSRALLTLSDKQGFLQVRVSGNEAAVPVGTYRLGCLEMAEKDSTGKYWSAHVHVPGNHAQVTIKPGATTNLASGSPFKVGLKASARGAARVFSLSIADQAGNLVSSVSNPAGQRPPAPTLRIRNARGAIMKETTFSYG